MNEPWIFEKDIDPHLKYGLSILIRAAGFKIYDEETHNKWINENSTSVGHYCDLDRRILGILMYSSHARRHENKSRAISLEYDQLVSLLEEKIRENEHK